jgi:hypothetical protein
MTSMVVAPPAAHRRERLRLAALYRISVWFWPARGHLRAEVPACRPAWELAGLTRIDRYDIAPWLFF